MIIEDRLTFDDEPAFPAPQPVVVVPVAPRAKLTLPSVGAILPYLVMVLALGFGGWQWWSNRDAEPKPPLPPTPTVDAVALGKSFSPKLAASLADGFETAATMIAAGTSVKDADEALKAKFQANRWAAFAELAGPTFDAVVPANQEPKDAATRAAFAELHRDFAKGLRGAK